MLFICMLKMVFFKIFKEINDCFKYFILISLIGFLIVFFIFIFFSMGLIIGVVMIMIGVGGLFINFGLLCCFIVFMLFL